jgi:hypothetical protein
MPGNICNDQEKKEVRIFLVKINIRTYDVIKIRFLLFPVIYLCFAFVNRFLKPVCRCYPFS